MERLGYQDLPNGMFDQLLLTEKFINDSTINMHLLELLRLRVSQINGCAYCVDMHHKELQHEGETDLRLSSLCVWKETPYFTPKERMVLSLSEALTPLQNEGVNDSLFDELRSYFSKSEIAILTLAVSQINTWTRLMRTFRFVPGQYKVQRT